MKRIGWVLLILLLIVAWIAMDGIQPSKSRLLDGVGKAETSRQTRDLHTGSARKAEENLQIPADRNNPEKAGKEVDPSRSIAVGADPTRALRIGSGAANGAVKPLHFIRSRSILKEENIDPENVRRLRSAVEEVVRESHFEVAILDADGVLTSQSPFLVWADPRLDLTEATAERFHRLAVENATAAEPSESAHQSSPRP